MAEGLNRVQLIGNVGQDPELRFTQSGQGILNMRLATNERFKGKDGEWQDRTEWHTVVVWGKRGEGLNKVVSKGTQLYVEGRLQTRSWEDKTGAKRYSTEVVAEKVLLLGSKGGGGRRSADDYDGPPADGGYGGGGGGGSPSSSGDDDIPFGRWDPP